jgi:hypothetical protein
VVYVGVLIVLRQPRRKGRVPCTPQISAHYASLVLCSIRAGAGSCTAAGDLSSRSLIGAMRGSGGRHLVPSLDLRSLRLIIAMQRSDGGPGRHLFPYSLRFTLTEPHRRHAARGPAAAYSRKAVNAAAGGGGSQVGRGGESADGEGGRVVKGVYFKF